MCSICCWQIIDLDISFRRFSSVPFVVSGWEGWWWWWRCTFAVHKRGISWKMSADQIVVLKRGKFKKIADLNLLILFRLKQICLNVFRLKEICLNAFQIETNFFECFSGWNKGCASARNQRRVCRGRRGSFGTRRNHPQRGGTSRK